MLKSLFFFKINKKIIQSHWLILKIRCFAGTKQCSDCVRYKPKMLHSSPYGAICQWQDMKCNFEAFFFIILFILTFTIMQSFVTKKFLLDDSVLSWVQRTISIIDLLLLSFCLVCNITLSCDTQRALYFEALWF